LSLIKTNNHAVATGLTVIYPSVLLEAGPSLTIRRYDKLADITGRNLNMSRSMKSG
jgi:hypothetical protein